MTPRLYRTLAASTVVATLVLIAVGAFVRTTGSGLGCPDWPQCHGAWVPPLERTAIVEYSHRTAAVVVSVLVYGLAAATYATRRRDRALVQLASMSVIVLLVQAYLGKITVERELPPWVVTSHMSTALLLLAAVSAMTAISWRERRVAAAAMPQRASVLRVLLVASVTTYVVLIWGAYVVKTGAGTSCISWPGCSAAPTPFVDGGLAQTIQWVHRLSVVVEGAVLGWAALVLRREAPGLQRGAWALVWLYGAQVLVGALNIWTDFSAAARVTHLALAATIWAVLIVTTVAAWYGDASEDARPAADGARTRTREEQSAGA